MASSDPVPRLSSPGFGDRFRAPAGLDYLPNGVRRAVVRAMSSDRIRLTLLDKLGIRKKSGFITLKRRRTARLSTSL